MQYYTMLDYTAGRNTTDDRGKEPDCTAVLLIAVCNCVTVFYVLTYLGYIVGQQNHNARSTIGASKWPVRRRGSV